MSSPSTEASATKVDSNRLSAVDGQLAPPPTTLPVELQLTIADMHCASCVAAIERAVNALPGVIRVQISLVNGSAIITYDEGRCNPTYIQQAILQAGYQIEAAVARDAGKNTTAIRAAQATGLCLVMLVLHFFIPTFPGQHYVMTGLAAIILVGPGRGILWRALTSSIRFKPGMDVLVAVGALASIVASFVYGIAPQFWPGSGTAPMFFDAAAIIVTVVLIGRWLEGRLQRKHLDAVDALLSVLPRSVTIERDGELEGISLDAVQIGDVLIVEQDEIIPADGMIERGMATCDQRFLTGESIPVDIAPGEEILAGSVNKGGRIHLQVIRTGGNTTLQSMAALLERAQATRPRIARLADAIAALFVPIVITIAVLTGLFWLSAGSQWLPEGTDPYAVALASCLAVLVVACPCALGLATPAAVVAGITKASEIGIIVKDSTSLERLASCTVLCCDKTGTITTGETKLAAIEPMEGYTPHEILGWAAKLEAGNTHPVAHAILAAAAECGIPTEGAEELTHHPGLGVQAVIGGCQIIVGREAYLAGQEIDVRPLATARDRVMAQGYSPVCIACGGVAAGVFGIGDSLRFDASKLVERTYEHGLHLHMLTGDRERIARAVAKELKIEKVIANQVPADKLNHITQLQEEGEQVVMVGDGINDGPALTQADVGISMGAGTQVAINSAQMVIPGDRLKTCTDAIALSRHVMKRIKQNLMIAFAYNIVAIPLAAGILFPLTGWLIHPGIAASAMAGSSLLVILNAMRLRWWQPRR